MPGLTDEQRYQVKQMIDEAVAEAITEERRRVASEINRRIEGTTVFAATLRAVSEAFWGYRFQRKY